MNGNRGLQGIEACEKEKTQQLSHGPLKTPWGKDAVGVQGCK